MKKSIILLLQMFALLVLSPAACADSKTPACSPSTTFLFPSSLVYIEEEAFAGTAARAAVFSDGMLAIDVRAFWGATSLKDVYIPISTVFIADSAFSLRDGFTIHGVEGSYARFWAENHQTRFAADNIWTSGSVTRRFVLIQRPVYQDVQKLVYDKKLIGEEASKNKGKSMRPQDRPELNPIDYRFP